jgi:hypothetical protein
MEALNELFRGLGGGVTEDTPAEIQSDPDAMQRERTEDRTQPSRADNIIDGLVVEVCHTFATTDSEAGCALDLAPQNRRLMLGTQETQTTRTDTVATDRSSSLPDGEHQEQGFLGRFFATKKVTHKKKPSLHTEGSSKDFHIEEIAIDADTRAGAADSSIYDSSSEEVDDDSEISTSSSQSHLYDASTIGGSNRSSNRRRSRDHGPRTMSFCSEESRDDCASSMGSASMSSSEDDDDDDEVSEYSSDGEESAMRLKSPSSGGISEKTFTFSVKDLMGFRTGDVEVKSPIADESRDDTPEVIRSISEDTPIPDDAETEAKKKRWRPWHGLKKQQRKFLFVSPKLEPIHESADDDDISSMMDAMSLNSSPSKRTRARMMGVTHNPEKEIAVPRKKAKNVIIPSSPKEALGSGWEITSFKQKKQIFFKPFNRRRDQEFVITVRTATPTSSAGQKTP